MLREDRPRGVAGVVSGLAAVMMAVPATWPAVDELTRAGGEMWLGIALIAFVPILIGFGVMLPRYLAVPSKTDKTLAVADPFSTACMSAGMLIGCIAIGAALGAG